MDPLQLVACRVAGAEYAFPITSVREIIRGVRTQPIGSPDPTALGIVDLRGIAMPVHDLSLALDMGASVTDPDARGDQRIVVTGTGDGAGGVIGWLVDGVDEVLEVDGARTEEVGSAASPAVRRIAHVGDGRLLPVLDVERLVRGRGDRAKVARPAA